MSLKTSGSTSSLLSSDNGNGHGRRGHTRTSSYESVGSSRVDEDRLMDYLNHKEHDIPEEEWRALEDADPAQVATRKNESLKQLRELDSLNKRFLDLNSDYKKLKLKAIGYYNQSQTNEKLVKELRAKEADLTVSHPPLALFAADRSLSMALTGQY